jgi:hypothetical protein
MPDIGHDLLIWVKKGNSNQVGSLGFVHNLRPLGRHYLTTPSLCCFDVITSLPLSLVDKIVSQVIDAAFLSMLRCHPKTRRIEIESPKLIFESAPKRR